MWSVKVYSLLVVLALSIMMVPVPAAAESMVSVSFRSASLGGLISWDRNCGFSLSMQSGMGDPFSASFSAGDDSMFSKADPGMALAGFPGTPSDESASSRKAHDRLDDLLTPVFFGCLLIALSRVMRPTKKNLKADHQARARVSGGVSYKDTLTAET